MTDGETCKEFRGIDCQKPTSPTISQPSPLALEAARKIHPIWPDDWWDNLKEEYRDEFRNRRQDAVDARLRIAAIIDAQFSGVVEALEAKLATENRLRNHYVKESQTAYKALGTLLTALGWRYHPEGDNDAGTKVVPEHWTHDDYDTQWKLEDVVELALAGLKGTR